MHALQRSSLIRTRTQIFIVVGLLQPQLVVYLLIVLGSSSAGDRASGMHTESTSMRKCFSGIAPERVEVFGMCDGLTEAR